MPCYDYVMTLRIRQRNRSFQSSLTYVPPSIVASCRRTRLQANYEETAAEKFVFGPGTVKAVKLSVQL